MGRPAKTKTIDDDDAPLPSRRGRPRGRTMKTKDGKKYIVKVDPMTGLAKRYQPQAHSTYNQARMWPLIREVIGAGYRSDQAFADALGVSKDTFKTWRKNEALGLGERMRRAIYANVALAHKNVRKAMEMGDVDLSKWYLTKNAPRYRDKTIVAVDVQESFPDDDVNEQTALDTRDAARAVLFMLAKARQSQGQLT